MAVCAEAVEVSVAEAVWADPALTVQVSTDEAVPVPTVIKEETSSVRPRDLPIEWRNVLQTEKRPDLSIKKDQVPVLQRDRLKSRVPDLPNVQVLNQVHVL